MLYNVKKANASSSKLTLDVNLCARWSQMLNESWCGSLFFLDYSLALSTISLCNFRNIIYFIVNIRKLYNIITFFLSIAFTTLFRRTWRHYLFIDYCRWPFAVTFIELITTDYRERPSAFAISLLVNHESASMELWTDPIYWT